MTKTELIAALEAIPGDPIVLCAPNGYDSENYAEIFTPVLMQVDKWRTSGPFGDPRIEFYHGEFFRVRESVETVDAIILE